MSATMRRTSPYHYLSRCHVPTSCFIYHSIAAEFWPRTGLPRYRFPLTAADLGGNGSPANSRPLSPQYGRVAQSTPGGAFPGGGIGAGRSDILLCWDPCWSGDRLTCRCDRLRSLCVDKILRRSLVAMTCLRYVHVHYRSPCTASASRCVSYHLASACAVRPCLHHPASPWRLRPIVGISCRSYDLDLAGDVRARIRPCHRRFSSGLRQPRDTAPQCIPRLIPLCLVPLD